MAPVRNKKRPSHSPPTASRQHARTAGVASSTKMLFNDSSSTPSRRSPIRKKRQMRAISVSQKQALVDNLQLEVTERARRLRAQYSIQGQNLKTRIEIRVNRIPVSLRRVIMGDLVARYQRRRESQQRQQQQQPQRQQPQYRQPQDQQLQDQQLQDQSHQEQQQQQQKRHLEGHGPSQVPVNDGLNLSPQKSTYMTARQASPGRPVSAHSDGHSGDKENESGKVDVKRKARGAAQATEAGRVVPAQVLSPTSSNSRIVGRQGSASPFKSQIARPGSPLKTQTAHRSAAVVLSSMVDKAKATRNAGMRKLTAASDESSVSSTTAAATKNRRPISAMSFRAPPPSRPATRAAGRTSGASEASEGSATTVVKKAGPVRPAAATKKTTMGVIRRGVVGAGINKATSNNKAANKPGAATGATKSSGRVLRRRG